MNLGAADILGHFVVGGFIFFFRMLHIPRGRPHVGCEEANFELCPAIIPGP